MRKPIVSIIGRPNVGKSTLFNRIIRKRDAIVDDVPGITRDRKMAEAEWEGVAFDLVDTGGFVPKSRDAIEVAVAQQVRFAIAEADVILFLVDCTVGITDADDAIARVLKKSGKSWILVVNKVDNEKRALDAFEFIRLGLGEPVSVSALEGRGMGDLLSILVETLGRPQKEEKIKDQNLVKLAVIGKPNVGKSTFINVILGEERLLVTEIPGTTRDAVDVQVCVDGHNFLLIDTAGMRRRSHIKENVEYYSHLRTHRVVEECDVASVFLDAEEGMTQQDMRVIQEVVETRKGILLVVNKWDLVEKDTERVRQWQETIEHRLTGMAYIPVVYVSCLKKLRVKNVLDLAWKISQERGKRISSPKLNELIEDMNRSYQPPAVQGKRVRILYGAQVGVKPPKVVFFSNYPHLIKESYKRFLENKLRAKFGFEGVPISFLFKKKR